MVATPTRMIQAATPAISLRSRTCFDSNSRVKVADEPLSLKPWTVLWRDKRSTRNWAKSQDRQARIAVNLNMAQPPNSLRLGPFLFFAHPRLPHALVGGRNSEISYGSSLSHPLSRSV